MSLKIVEDLNVGVIIDEETKLKAIKKKKLKDKIADSDIVSGEETEKE